MQTDANKAGFYGVTESAAKYKQALSLQKQTICVCSWTSAAKMKDL